MILIIKHIYFNLIKGCEFMKIADQKNSLMKPIKNGLKAYLKGLKG